VPAKLSDGIALARPESVGFSSESLKDLDTGMQAIVDARHLAGVVTLVARHGKVVQHKAYGVQDVATQTPMQLDTIVRIYSMTKPIAGAAMMMRTKKVVAARRSDRGYIPEFANLKCSRAWTRTVSRSSCAEPSADDGRTDVAQRGFTLHLFAGRQDVPADNPLTRRRCRFIDKVKTAVAYQPGEKWVCSVSVTSRATRCRSCRAPRFLIFCAIAFMPLGMKDTGFMVPEAKPSRVPTITRGMPRPRRSRDRLTIRRSSKMPGLLGRRRLLTAADYFHFAQTMLNGGELNGKRLLKQSSVDMMRTNVLNDETLNSKSGIGPVHLSPELGFGYDFAVMRDPAALKSPLGKGSYWWWGIAGTWFWNDPNHDVPFIDDSAPRSARAPRTTKIAKAAVYGLWSTLAK
jgi:hypothetical protein